MARAERERAIFEADARCPRCAAPREARQEYCIECGLRLPVVRGRVPALRRRWVRRVGWYPGDWIWVSLLTLLVAVGGAAAAIALGGNTASSAATTAIATSPQSPLAAAAPPPLAPRVSTKPPKRGEPAPSAVNGETQWPAGRNGWTIVLSSYPVTSGTAAPDATASRAARTGLPQVGVLDSGDFSSLHPGYYVVFSGVYSSSGEADAALRSVQAAGFASAYTRQIAR